MVEGQARPPEKGPEMMSSIEDVRKAVRAHLGIDAQIPAVHTDLAVEERWAWCWAWEYTVQGTRHSYGVAQWDADSRKWEVEAF